MIRFPLIGIIAIAAFAGTLFSAAAFFLLNNCDSNWCLLFDWQKEKRAQNFSECAALGFPVTESYPRQCAAGDRIFVEDIIVQAPGDEHATSAEIRVSKPKPGDIVGLPLVIEGEARTFENTVNFRLRAMDGAVLVEHFTTAAAPDIGEFGHFRAEVAYPEPHGSEGIVEVFEYSAKDGSEINMVAVPVFFAQDIEATTMKVFFGNEREDPDFADCGAVSPVERRIATTPTVGRAAIEELLKGPTVTEQNQGFLTSIPSGVSVQKLTIEDGVARIDFDDALERYGGGSCRVAAIRAQITETLKQFPTVSEVVISVDGRTEDILQP